MTAADDGPGGSPEARALHDLLEGDTDEVRIDERHVALAVRDRAAASVGDDRVVTFRRCAETGQYCLGVRARGGGS